MRLYAKAATPLDRPHHVTDAPPRQDAEGAAEPSGGRVGDKGVGWFVALAFGFSWAWLLPLAITGRSASAGVGWPTQAPALLGPLLAAFVVTARQHGGPGVLDLLGRMVKINVPLRWWLFAVSPFLLLLLVLVIDVSTSQPLPLASDFAAFSGLPSGWGVMGVGGVIVLMGFCEETGWRGYALPHLQRRTTPLRATALVWVVWALWHAPMFMVVDTYRSFNAAITLGWAMGLFCGAVVLSWLYNRSGGSILLVAVWHAAYNVISGTNAATGLLAATSTTLVIALAVTLVALEIRASRQGRPSVLGPRLP